MSTSVNDVKAVSTKRAVFGKLKATVVLGDDGITYIQRSHAVKGLKVISQTFVCQINKLTGSAGVAIQMDDELPRESWRKFVSVSHINDYCRLLAKSNSHKKEANPEFVKWINGTVFFEPTSFDDTFNDDTPAQTFGGIQRDMGTQDKSEAILVTACSKCGSTVPADSVDKPALSRWAARFLKAVKGIEVSE